MKRRPRCRFASSPPTSDLSAAHNKTTMAIFGPPGCGKTSLLKTLPPDQTVCLDLEAGMKSVQDWPGDSIPVRTFADFRDLAVLIGGPIPRPIRNAWYSAQHYQHAREHLRRHRCRRVSESSDHLRRQHHRSHPPGDGLGQDSGRKPSPKAPASPTSAAPTACSRARSSRRSSTCSTRRQDGDLRRHPRERHRRVQRPPGSRRWKAARRPASSPASSIR